MKALREFIDKQKPHFQKGGKFYWLQSTFEGFETFLYVPNKVTTKGAHIRDSIDMKRAMIVVVLATLPALFFGMWNVGYQHFLSLGEATGFWQNMGFGALKIVPIIVVSYAVGLGIEFYFAQIKGHEINEGYLVTGMLIPLIVPPDIPLWILAVAIAFAVIFGKEVFGGTGMNVVNPALVARAFLFFAYPGDMSGDKVWIAEKADTFSGATPLGNALVGNFHHFPSFSNMFMGYIPGSVGETSTLMILIGAAILLITGIASWRVMVSVFAGGLIMGLLFNWWGANEYMELPAYYHLVMGGFAFGAVFMATDPVTSAQTTRGKYIYGFLVGMMAVLIRVFNPAYPEGMMLAILLMNVFAPLIDHYVIESNIKKRLKRLKVAANS